MASVWPRLDIGKEDWPSRIRHQRTALCLSLFARNDLVSKRSRIREGDWHIFADASLPSGGGAACVQAVLGVVLSGLSANSAIAACDRLSIQGKCKAVCIARSSNFLQSRCEARLSAGGICAGFNHFGTGPSPTSAPERQLTLDELNNSPNGATADQIPAEFASGLPNGPDGRPYMPPPGDPARGTCAMTREGSLIVSECRNPFMAKFVNGSCRCDR